MQLNHVETHVARRLGDFEGANWSKDPDSLGSVRHAGKDRPRTDGVDATRTLGENDTKVARAERGT
jgi:hypothetical protein